MVKNQAIHDRVYGTYRVSSPVLLDLLDTPAVQRLRGIHQGGASYLVRTKRDTSRFDHVVGVMLLISILGGSVEEQVAGLIHDVSHTAFSHVIDQVFQRSNEDFHEMHFNRLVADSSIPLMLRKHSVKPDIFNIEQWTLLEQPSPELCADRIDYTLRDLERLGIISQADCKTFVSSLRLYHAQIVVADLDKAVWFTEQYVKEVQDLFMNPLELYANAQLAQAIRIALDRAIITEDDLFGQDDAILTKLQSVSDPQVMLLLEGLSDKAIVVEDPVQYDFQIHPKARIVDPLVLLDSDRVARCSTLVPGIKALNAEVIRRAREGICVRRV